MRRLIYSSYVLLAILVLSPTVRAIVYGAPPLNTGPTQVARPASAIDVTPGTDLSVLMSGQQNKIYWLKAGLHTTNGNNVYPGVNTTIIGEYLGPGEGQQAVVSGFKGLSGWQPYKTGVRPKILRYNYPKIELFLRVLGNTFSKN
jgi:hypothetical protein